MVHRLLVRDRWYYQVLTDGSQELRNALLHEFGEFVVDTRTFKYGSIRTKVSTQQSTQLLNNPLRQFAPH